MSARRKRLRQRRLSRVEPPPTRAPEQALHELGDIQRLAYSRRQAAEALGVSIATIDRRVVPSISTIKTPWGQRLIPVAELERFVAKHLQHRRTADQGRGAGRRPVLPERVVNRVRLEYARGRGLAEIARALNDDGIPTAHGGRRWWPSTVRAVLVRSTPPVPAQTTEESSRVVGGAGRGDHSKWRSV